MTKLAMKRIIASALAGSLLVCVNAFAAEVSNDRPVVTDEWRSYIEPVAPIGERMAARLPDSQDPQMREELYRYIYAIIAQGYFSLLYQDAKYPDFWPMFNLAFNFAYPNPDDAYYQAAIEGGGVYKISGVRGTAHLIDVQIGSGMFIPYGIEPRGPTLSNIDLDHDAHIRKDSTFEVILSAERPKGYKGDWWPLDPRATFLWIRQISYDWVHEVDGRFAIERLDVPAIKPRDSAAKIAERLKLISTYAQNQTDFALGFDERLLKRGLINKLAVVDYSGLGGFKTQLYIEGMFDLAPDEALIMETEIPQQCRYWNFELADRMTAALDWINRQTTLNGYSSRRDADGKFRAVISSQDPGVPNWLDTAGYQRGHIFGRWKECSSTPTPTLTKVKVADVRKYLPADTPVVTAEARDATIRLRRKAAQLRRRW